MTSTVPISEEQTSREVDPQRLDALVGSIIGDVGATVSAGLVVLGDRLGLYAALRGGVRLTPAELAERTGTSAVYLAPWLANQAASGFVELDPVAGTWSMTPEQEAVLGDPESTAFFAGAMQVALGALHAVPEIEERFRTGRGFGWHEHHGDLFLGTERFFRPGYVANLVPTWLPALDGVVPKLRAGADVVDVGCGHGASTILMAQAFEQSSFVGIDYHQASVEVARVRAEEAGVSDRVRFEVVDAADLPAGQADLVTTFDCLHDMGDPDGAARAVRRALSDDGTFMVVEPMAGDRIEDNLNPVGRIFYGASTLICTPSSLAQPGQRALGTQAGPAVLSSLLRDAGFGRVRVATTTPVNLILEARP